MIGFTPDMPERWSQMRDQGHQVLYYENMEGGHGGAADNQQGRMLKP